MKTNDTNSESRLRAQFSSWYEGPLGQLLAAREQAELDGIVPNLFGYHIVQLGCVGSQDLLGASRIRHRVVLHVDGAREGVGALARPDALPLATDSVDALLLPHTLELHDNPHEVLREVARVLIPEGHVVVLGFNPVSLWGAVKLLCRWRGGIPWEASFYSVTRVRDWLALLGFETRLVRFYLFRPPLRRAVLLRRLEFLERLGARWWPMLGAAYLLVARKRVVTLTPIKPRWRPRRSLVAGGLAEPTRWGFERHG